MDPKFWLERWRTGQLGFHNSQVNPALVERWGALGLERGDLVFVPLSGKSLDMWWLRDRGHGVLGVELSPIAVRDFFVEAGLHPRTFQQGAFQISEANDVRLLQGDVFDLRAEDLAGVRGVYDRAALIALPPNLRRAYTRSLIEYLPRPVSILLLCFEADPPKAGGPPFSIAEGEVRDLFQPAFEVEVLQRAAFTEAPPALRASGFEAVAEVVYGLRRVG